MHVLCAEFVPGLMYEDEQLREPVLGTEKAVKERAKLVSPDIPSYSDSRSASLDLITLLVC